MCACVLFIPELKMKAKAQRFVSITDWIRVVVVGAVAVDAMMMVSVSVKRERSASTPWWAR